MKPKVTLIAVADGSQARFYLHERPGEAIRLAPFPAMAIVNPRTHEQGTDRPGRTFNSMGARRSAMENPADWHQQAEDRFARDVAQRIDEIMRGEPGWRLVLVAAPETLGELRQALAPQTRQRVLGELAKDFAKTPEKRLNQALEELLPVG
jgi:protein required for attachment to host cells